MKHLTVFLFLVIPGLVRAQVIHCTSGKSQRKISVIKNDQGPKCETKYVKEDGAEKIIYKADNSSDFCLNKAKEFSEKLKSMGWECKE